MPNKTVTLHLSFGDVLRFVQIEDNSLNNIDISFIVVTTRSDECRVNKAHIVYVEYH